MGIFNSRGVKPAHRKHTDNQRAVRLENVASVTIPMRQHIGAPCTPTVKVGDVVAVGQVIGDSEEYLSVPVHASVSGTVTAIKNITLADGKSVQAVTIKSDGKMTLYKGITPPTVTDRR